MDKPRTVYHYPGSMFVADFIGSPPINMFKASLERNTADGSIYLKLDNSESLKTSYSRQPDSSGTVHFAVRPEKIILNTDNKNNQITGHVKTVLPSGAETVIQVEAGNLVFNVLMQQDVEFSVGEKVMMYIPETGILLYDSDGKLIQF
jgi:multiple sugar transport system ATP-binding protein